MPDSTNDQSDTERPCRGKVYLVGAGPGDPGLITVKATDCLKVCDVVLYDYLVNPQFLEWTSENCLKQCLGSHAGGKIWRQERINAEMIDLANQGKTVVRLKGGDPLIFGRSGEEIESLRNAKIPFEIVPGISAAMAAGAYAGLPLTHRNLSSSFALVTAARKNGDHQTDDYIQLAKFPGTIAIYMGTTTVEYWSQELIRHGKAGETPVKIIRNATLSRQQTIHCRLDQVAEVVSGPPKLRPPAIFLIGEIAREEFQSNWFESQPLFGKTVLLTRAAEQNASVRKRLEGFGCSVLEYPMIQIEAVPIDAALTELIRKIDQFDWITFTSANGVKYCIEQIFDAGFDLRVFSNSRIAVIGSSTQRCLESFHLKADLVPAEFNSESLSNELLRQTDQSSRCLIVQGNRGRKELQYSLRKHGREVESMVVYRTSDIGLIESDLIDTFENRDIDWVTVSSPAIARNVATLLQSLSRQAKLASISPLTSAALRDHGLEATVEARVYSMDGMIDAILERENEVD